jgi:hypothetical protein
MASSKKPSRKLSDLTGKKGVKKASAVKGGMKLGARTRRRQSGWGNL